MVPEKSDGDTAKAPEAECDRYKADAKLLYERWMRAAGKISYFVEHASSLLGTDPRCGLKAILEQTVWVRKLWDEVEKCEEAVRAWDTSQRGTPNKVQSEEAFNKVFQAVRALIALSHTYNFRLYDPEVDETPEASDGL